MGARSEVFLFDALKVSGSWRRATFSLRSSIILFDVISGVFVL